METQLEYGTADHHGTGLVSTPSLLVHYGLEDPDTGAPTQPPSVPTSTNPPDSTRFREFIASIDLFLATAVEKLTPDLLADALSDVRRDEPERIPVLAVDMRRMIVEQCKADVIRFVRDLGLRDRINALHAQTLRARDALMTHHGVASEDLVPLTPLSAAQIKDLMCNTDAIVREVRARVLRSTLASLRQQEAELQATIAVDVGRLRAALIAYKKERGDRDTAMGSVQSILNGLSSLNAERLAAILETLDPRTGYAPGEIPPHP
ncbi:hypothetical protein BC828DRAFT_371980 [Blastocladiella britannica]|nr:hypothetical protein BC828DRAFT_371980 [Blastocladiella britannica]